MCHPVGGGGATCVEPGVSKAEVEFISHHAEDLEMPKFFLHLLFCIFFLDVAKLQRDGHLTLKKKYGEILSRNNFMFHLLVFKRRKTQCVLCAHLHLLHLPPL